MAKTIARPKKKRPQDITEYALRGIRRSLKALAARVALLEGYRRELAQMDAAATVFAEHLKGREP